MQGADSSVPQLAARQACASNPFEEAMCTGAPKALRAARDPNVESASAPAPTWAARAPVYSPTPAPIAPSALAHPSIARPTIRVWHCARDRVRKSRREPGRRRSTAHGTRLSNSNIGLSRSRDTGPLTVSASRTGSARGRPSGRTSSAPCGADHGSACPRA